jgi:hypothetical protein
MILTPEMIEAAARTLDPLDWIDETNRNNEFCYCEKCREERRIGREASYAR